MAAAPIFGTIVNRLCRIRSGTGGDELPFPLDENGFLDPTAPRVGSADSLTPGALVAPEVAAEAGALVLLGEPGLGKTTVFERLVQLMSEAGGNPQVVSVDAADLTDETFEDLVGRHLRALPPAQATGRAPNATTELTLKEGEQTLIMVIDQVDESPIVRRLAGLLRASLQGRATSSVRIFLACRTADYPSSLSEALQSACGDCVLADLAPLTLEEAVELASSADGVDGSALLAAAVDAGAGALASVPLTLGLLVRTYRETGSLDARPAELFARGVTQLLEEHDDRRQLADDESTVEQRRAIAGRIAARLLLSGRRTIWSGRVLESGEHDLNADSLAGGQEALLAGSFEVTKRMVLATLATALFTGRGQNRLAFRHGSIAAYLAARYLIDREVPRPQLEALFLVAGGDEARSIPTLLRETAAWLVTLYPVHANWLAEADPESLVSHSAIVDSYEVRALIVDSLLRRAGEVELGDVPWARSPRRIYHPGLDDQLLAALGPTGAGQPQDWQSLARVRLAVRLARDAKTPGLVEPLLQLAESDDWDAHTRELAAQTAFEIDPGRAIPRLTRLLERFANLDYAVEIDPDDELRGTLLKMLWPHHLPAERALIHLRPRRNRDLIGMYLMFERTFAETLPEEDIGLVLQWAKSLLYAEARAAVTAVAEDDSEAAVSVPEERPVGAVDTELIEGIVDRALTGATGLNHVKDVAALLLPRLQRYDRPPLPAPVDLEDAHGQEPAAARDLRRALARSLVELTVEKRDFHRADAWRVVGDWGRSPGAWPTARSLVPGGLRRAGRTHLLTTADFWWTHAAAAEAKAEGKEELADALGQLAAMVFYPPEVEIVDLVYSSQAHPAWKYLSWWFEPVDLKSELAEQLREAHSHRQDEDESWPEREQFVSNLQKLLADAVSGNTDAFWRLLWNLQLDPVTGRGHQRFDDDLLSFPAIETLGGEAIGALAGAASHYVASEHDHAREWLGTDRYDKRGWAGYLALALLERQGRLGDVPDDAWGSWVGALIWFPAVPVNAGNRERKVTLLSHAARHAATDLAEGIAIYTRGELGHGRSASELELVDPAWNPELVDTCVTILRELEQAIVQLPERQGHEQERASDTGAAPDTSNAPSLPPPIVLLATDEAQSQAFRLWEVMLMALFNADTERAIEIAHSALESRATGQRGRLLAARVARAMLRTDASGWWEEIHAVARQDDQFSRELALACATHRLEAPLLGDLLERQLGMVYRWLSTLFLPEEDVQWQGARFLSPEDQARDWRDRVLQQLSERGTEQAVLTLAKLSEEHPERLVITASLLRARTYLFASAWAPPEPEELAALFEDARRRLVRSEVELAELVREVLEAVQVDLPGHAELLWDRLPQRLLPEESNLKDAWLPKPEAALSAYVAHELSSRLDRRGLAVNREVLVRPRGAYGAGDRTDVLVEATMLHGLLHGPVPTRVAVVIEIKGAWNEGLMTAQRGQLAERYLPEAHTQTGIYLVGWYPPDLWTDESDYRRNRIKNLHRDDLIAGLESQAETIRTELGRRTQPLLLEVPGPHAAQSATVKT
jgi:hypothetical protein